MLRGYALVLFAVPLLLVGAACGGKATKRSNASVPTFPGRTTTYPGAGASQSALARWMGSAASAAGLPPELPVMAALAESGLTNTPADESGRAGFFEIPVRIWNQGDYAGFPDRPELQLKWFVDQALAARRSRNAAGTSTTDPSTWGDWVADVERPQPQFRGRYQLKLDQARSLLGK